MLTERLQECIDPFAGLAIYREVVEEDLENGVLEPVQKFKPYNKRTLTYDYGRIRFFVEELLAGVVLDPVYVDSRTAGFTTYISNQWVLVDGHHRFCAYVLVGEPTIPVIFSGRVDVADYLRGHRDTLPADH